MVSALISRVVILVFGTLYPAYSSYKAVKTKNVKEYVKWMMYWIVFAFFTCIETFADIFVAWLPFYYELKILFVLWLLSPATKGSSILYRKFIHPQLSKREKDIDKYITHASDKGYTALLSFGSKAVSYATNVAVTTAIKGQTAVVEQMKKSYSLNDLSGDNRQAYVNDEDNVDFDDDEDNRMIEESYQREMMEKEQQEMRRQESQEEGSIKPRRAPYQHKEAYHYGTLPRSKGRTRASLKKRGLEEEGLD